MRMRMGVVEGKVRRTEWQMGLMVWMMGVVVVVRVVVRVIVVAWRGAEVEG
jgi:polyisoprenoid-binding protein YceI